MTNNTFFKPTILYKEYLILDMIEKNPKITQREMSNTMGIAVSMINYYLDDFEKQGYIKRTYHSTKTVEYFITKKGSERRKVLNIGYLNASQSLYNSAKENIERFLRQVAEKGFRNILLYGSGEVAEMLLSTIKSSKTVNLNVIAVVDDDVKKQGSLFFEQKIISRDEIPLYDHDGILISSFTNRIVMVKNLLEQNYNESKIINFFDFDFE